MPFGVPNFDNALNLIMHNVPVGHIGAANAMSFVRDLGGSAKLGTAVLSSMADIGFLKAGDHLIHDRDGKYCPVFLRTLEDVGVKPLALPPRRGVDRVQSRLTRCGIGFFWRL